MRKLWISILLMISVFMTAQAIELETVRTGQDGPWCYAVDARDQITITDWRWEELAAIPDVVEIPAELDGCPVYKLGRNAFSTQGLTVDFALAVPEGVSAIEMAFVNCGAREIMLPGTIGTIMGSSLRGCRAEITLADGGRFLTVEDGFLIWTDNRLMGNGLRYLVYAAPSAAGKALPEMDFLSHYALENYLTADVGAILLPENVQLVGYHDLPRGVTLTAANPDATYTARNESGLFEYRKSTEGAEITKWCYWYADEIPETVVVPGMVDGLPVRHIGKQAFYAADHPQDAACTIILPEGLVSLDKRALWRCSAASIHLPATLQEMPEDALAGYHGQISLAENHPTLTWQDGFLVNTAASTLLYAVGSETLPQVRRIGEGALEQWSGPSTLRIPDGVESIGAWLFRNGIMGERVQRLILPDSLTEVGDAAFYGTQIREVEFGSGLTRIPDDAFANARLTAVTLPETVTFVAWSAFDHQVQVNALNPDCVPESFGDYANRTGEFFALAADGTLKYWNYQHMHEIPAEVTFPAAIGGTNVTTLGAYAFASNGEIGTAYALRIPEGVVKADANAFSGCEAHTVYLPSTLTDIGPNCFAGFAGKIVMAENNPRYRVISGCLYDRDTNACLYVPLNREDN